METILITTSSCGKEDPAPLEILRNAGYAVILNPYGRKLNQKEAMELFLKHDPVGMVAGVESLTKEVLAAAKNLRVISRCGIGLDNIDQEAASKRNIVILNTPGAPCRAVAELTVGLMITTLRKIVMSCRSIQKGEWERPMGRLLYQKEVGIIGCGRIGSIVAELLSSFGVELLGYDPNVKEHPTIIMSSLEELLQRADLISLHLPYNSGTHHIVDKEFLCRMKEGAILINTSRGGLVDEEALYESIKEGRLDGAAIDTFEEEPYTGKMLSLPNVVLTSHIGSYAKEARVIMEKEAAMNLLTHLKGQVK